MPTAGMLLMTALYKGLWLSEHGLSFVDALHFTLFGPQELPTRDSYDRKSALPSQAQCLVTALCNLHTTCIYIYIYTQREKG